MVVGLVVLTDKTTSLQQQKHMYVLIFVNGRRDLLPVGDKNQILVYMHNDITRDTYTLLGEWVKHIHSF